MLTTVILAPARDGRVGFGPFWHQNRGQAGQAGCVPGMPGRPGVFQGATPRGGLHPQILILVSKQNLIWPYLWATA